MNTTISLPTRLTPHQRQALVAQVRHDATALQREALRDVIQGALRALRSVFAGRRVGQHVHAA